MEELCKKKWNSKCLLCSPFNNGAARTAGTILIGNFDIKLATGSINIHHPSLMVMMLSYYIIIHGLLSNAFCSSDYAVSHECLTNE
jgi:hypothetical protein